LLRLAATILLIVDVVARGLCMQNKAIDNQQQLKTKQTCSSVSFICEVASVCVSKGTPQTPTTKKRARAKNPGFMI